MAEPRPSAKFDAPEKIVVRQTGDSLIATLDNEQFVCMNNMHTVILRDDKCDLRFILGLLNSRVLNYYFQWLNPEKGEALDEVKKEHVENLVIKRGSPAQRADIAKLVQRTLEVKEKDHSANTVALECDIDRLVYALYSLTPDEIRLMEESAHSSGGRAELTPCAI